MTMSRRSQAACRAFSRVLWLVGAALMAAGAAGPVAAQSTFSRGDWELACDNTRTCRAVGYQPEDGTSMPLALLVEREAGPNKFAKVQVMLPHLDREPAAPAPSQAELVIDGRRHGHVVLTGEGDTGELTVDQSAVLLRAVLGTGEVAFEAPDDRWVLSTSGANAVLLRMDDLQGRVDTAGALVRKGSRPDTTVLPPLPAPLVRAAPLVEPRPGDEALGERIRPFLKVGRGDICESIDPSFGPGAGEGEAAEKEPITVRRLSADRVVLSTLCWRAAYNEGYGVWLAADKPPYAPKLVTSYASEVLGQTIEARQKGRGIGDCWALDTWTWDGRDFVHSSSLTTGMCKQVALGGAWPLPTLVTAGSIPPTR